MKDTLSNRISPCRVGSVATLRLIAFTQGKSIKELIYNELKKQISEKPEVDALFPQEAIIAYRAFEPVRDSVDNPDVYVTRLRYYWMYSFFKQEYPDIFKQETKILKVGDPSGNLLSTLNKQGTSVNINRECVNFIKNKGMDAVLGDAESLNYADSSFDYIFSFQCLEHLANPVRALNEFGRVAKKKVFVSIPYTDETRIYNVGYWLKLQKDQWGITRPQNFDCHVFEFSTEDFKNILSHTSLAYESNFLIPYFDNTTPVRCMLNKYLRSYFNFFVLRPVKNKGT